MELLVGPDEAGDPAFGHRLGALPSVLLQAHSASLATLTY